MSASEPAPGSASASAPAPAPASGHPPGEPSNLIVLSSSHPLRDVVACALRDRGFDVTESASIVDALQVMGSAGVPTGLVISSNVDQRRGGVELVRRMSNLPKTSALPAVLLVDNMAELYAIQAQPLPMHAVPIVIPPKLDIVAGSVVAAHEVAKAHAPTRPNVAEVNDGGSGGEEDPRVAELNKAVDQLTDVLERVVKGSLPGPIVPDLMRQVQEVVGDPEVEFSTIERFALKHQTLAARLLSMANSAYYSRGVRAKTVAHGVSRLGLKQTSALMRAIAMKSFVVGKDPVVRAMLTERLEHAYLTGVIARDVALRDAREHADTAYTVGLFHNIGAAFFLYTYALLRDRGEAETVDPDALEALCASRAGALNRTVAEAMQLPAEVAVVAGGRKSHGSAVVPIVRRAIWAADRIFFDKQERMTLTSEAELIGFDDEALDALNERLPNLVGLLADYRG